MPDQEFGGDWTQQKLQILDKYLAAYCQIFRQNERAKFFKTIYVDAFAGTGVIQQRPGPGEAWTAAKLLEGSAGRAIRHSFHKYLFIEKSADRVAELEKLKANSEVRDRIFIRHGDANQKLLDFARSTDWKRHRAVVFLDPYGMQVEWETIQALGGRMRSISGFCFPLVKP